MAQKHSASYIQPEPINAALPYLSNQMDDLQVVENNAETVSSATNKAYRCFFCGYNRHPRNQCPAEESLCLKCEEEHYVKVYR